MNDTITLPRNTFERIEEIIRRLVAKVEPTDEEARTARKEAVALIQIVTELTDTKHLTHNERNGAQGLLELARLAEKENWTGPTDLAERHDAYFIKAWEEGRQED